MATTVSSAKAGASRAVLYSATKALKGPKLADAMHRSLYPHLYQGTKPISRKIRAAPHTLKRYKQVEVEREKRKVSWYRNKMRNSSSKNLPQQAQKPRAIKKTCSDPISALTNSQIAIHDPTGARTRLFDRGNSECARVGDVLLVRQRTGEPFAGVCINIRRRGIDTAILLRGQLTRVGVEMWYKVYSPLVEGIEVVQRAQKKVRRARLTYMRNVKHDRGSVENIVRVYLRQKAALGSSGGKKDAAAKAAAGGKKGNKRGKRR